MNHVPIIMYHSVSDNRQWLWGHLSCPVSVFKNHVEALANAGFSTISLPELYNHRTRGCALPPRPIVLTFDDGYLDNWVYAYPILKQHGFLGTIFVNPEFIDPAIQPRPTLEDVETGTISISDLKDTGFLSWAEMARMQADGVMDIQSHSLTHTWYFNNAHPVNFHHPGDGYPWLAWNIAPDQKYRWLDEDQSPLVAWGTPVYGHEKALVARRYFPDPRLTDLLTAYVIQNGGSTFFLENGWSERLLALHAQYRRQNHPNESWESEAEYQHRVRHELGASREIIASTLRNPVNFLCWPGGGYNSTTERIAQETGYLAATLAGSDPRRANPQIRHLVRWGAPTLHRNGKTLYRDGRYLAAMLRCRQGNKLACLQCKLLTGRDLVSLALK